MLSSLVTLGVSLTLANALAVRGSSCTVHLSVDGAIHGPVGQLPSGQGRVGEGHSGASFPFNNNGFTDSKGRGCFWTPPTYVFQCDEGKTPDNNFQIGCDGSVSYKGSKTFWECDAEQGTEHNVYLKKPNGVNCKEITLHADGCRPNCPPPPPPPPPGNKGCPTNLNGNYEFPHLIIPVDSSKPNYAPGTSYNGKITGTVSSLFNFDIPYGDKGKTCSLVFLFPKQEDLETSSFTFSGDGNIDFALLNGPAKESTTYNNKPGVKKDYGVTTVSPGHSYRIATFDCPAGQTVGFELAAKGSTMLDYFQDYNPSPIGLYITVC